MATRAEPTTTLAGNERLAPLRGAQRLGASEWIEAMRQPAVGCAELGFGVAARDLAAHEHEQVPSFLSAKERSSYAQLRVDKRRRDWLLGRLTAKRLVQRVAGEMGLGEVPLDAISIEPAADGAPTIVPLDPRLLVLASASLSISHSAATSVCALSLASPVGVDLEQIEPRSRAFVEDYFTADEQRQVAMASDAGRAVVATAIWSAKEAVLKALRLGLTIDTRTLSCRLEREPANGWCAFDCRWDRTRALPETIAAGPFELVGQWRRAGAFVLCVASLGQIP